MTDPVLDAPAPSPVPAPPAPGPAAPVPAPSAPPADFDLSALPEQIRPHVEPIFKQTVERYKGEISKREEAAKAFQEKAGALDRLLSDSDFQRWWIDRQNPKPTSAQEPAPVVEGIGPEEFQAAYEKAMNGDTADMNRLTEKQLDLLVQKKYAPVISQLDQRQREMNLSMEMSNLFQAHPDAKELDKMGLLEPALHLFTDKQKRPMAYAYEQAKKAYETIYSRARSELIAESQGKKQSVTEPPASHSGGAEVVMVDTPQQALKQQLTAQLRGSNAIYRVRPRGK